VLFIEGSDQRPLLKLCQEAMQEATQQKENQVSLWRYDTRGCFWMQMSRRWARHVDTVVLEDSIRQPLYAGWASGAQPVLHPDGQVDDRRHLSESNVAAPALTIVHPCHSVASSTAWMALVRQMM